MQCSKATTKKLKVFVKEMKKRKYPGQINKVPKETLYIICCCCYCFYQKNIKQQQIKQTTSSATS